MHDGSKIDLSTLASCPTQQALEDWRIAPARRSGPFHDLPRKELKLGKGWLLSAALAVGPPIPKGSSHPIRMEEIQFDTQASARRISWNQTS